MARCWTVSRTVLPVALVVSLAALAGHELYRDEAIGGIVSRSLRSASPRRSSALPEEAAGATEVQATEPAAEEPKAKPEPESVEAVEEANMVGDNMTAAAAASCLCVFDIDRTLTGKQWVTAPKCPNNRVFYGIQDWAYGGGTLTLSEVGLRVSETFCGGCYVATVSHGTAGGQDEKNAILKTFRGVETPPNVWSWGCNVVSPMVLQCDEGQKQHAVRKIIQWYRNNRGATIPEEEVYMFDDRADNIAPFRSTRFNARQISCATREEPVGFCGATLSEIQRVKGVSTCR